MRQVDEATRSELRDWLAKVVKKTGMAPTRLANHIGVSPSTLTRPLNDPEYESVMSTTTISKLVAVSGLPAPASLGGNDTPGMGESEVARYSPQASENTSLSVQNNAESEWVVQTMMLDLDGYLPGDHVIVNLNEAPRSGDVVLAQIYSEQGTAETVFRRYEAPFLVTHTTQRHMPKPVFVDNERAVIMGVVTRSWRFRAKSRNAA